MAEVTLHSAGLRIGRNLVLGGASVGLSLLGLSVPGAAAGKGLY